MNLIQNTVQNMQNMLSNLSMSDAVNVLIALLGLVLVLRAVCPHIMKAELFAETEAAAEAAADPEAALPEDPLAAPALEDGQMGPVYDTDKQLIMDGRGMQVGPVDPAEGSEAPVGVDSIPNDFYHLDDGANGKMSIQHNMCSRSCCSEQFNLPFRMKHDPFVCNLKKEKKLSASRIMCSNSFQDSGCLCITKEQAQNLYNRAGNGRGYF